MTERRYSKEEVDAILGRAIEREHNRGELAHEDLVAAALEIGIPATTIEAAASEVLAERGERDEIMALRKQQWRGFLRHLVPYLFVNGFLVALNVLTTHFPWSLFPLFGWGIGLVSHLMSVILPSRWRLERHLERQRDRERRRQVKEQIRANARQIEQNVGQGISTLLQAAADRIAGTSNSENRDGPRRVRYTPVHSAPDPGVAQDAPNDPSWSQDPEESQKAPHRRK
jgi:hypothetical protein